MIDGVLTSIYWPTSSPPSPRRGLGTRRAPNMCGRCGAATAWLAAIALSSLGVATPATAQDAAVAETPTPARIAPLAVDSLLLDGAAAGSRLVAVGERGHIMVSDDDGQSWRQVEAPASATLTGVAFADDMTGWAIGHDSVILHTQDGGETWDLQHFRTAWEWDLEKPLLDLTVLDTAHAIAVGAYGLYMVTEDGGETWQDILVDLDEFHHNRIMQLPSGGMVMPGEAGGLFVRPAADAEWQSYHDTSPYIGSFFGGLALSDDDWVLFGLQGHIFRTADAGQTWDQIDSGVTAVLTGGAILEDGRVVIVGSSGTVLVSEDQASSFSLYQRPRREALAAVLQAQDGHLILLGDAGVLRVPADDPIQDLPQQPTGS